jgi:RHS repeat-associated protein
LRAIRDEPKTVRGSRKPPRHETKIDFDGHALSTDAAGACVARFQYDTFGNVVEATGPSAILPSNTSGDFRFHGMWLDPTGYYHARARAYDPRSGRFTSRDPVLGDELVPETWMPYAFGLNNPAVFRDPTGLMTLGDAGAASVAAQNISLAAAQSVRGAQVALGGATLTTAGVLKFAVATASLTLSAIVGIRVIPDDLEPWLETRPWGEYFELMMLQQLCGFQRALPKNRTLYIDVALEARILLISCSPRSIRQNSVSFSDRHLCPRAPSS